MTSQDPPVLPTFDPQDVKEKAEAEKAKAKEKGFPNLKRFKGSASRGGLSGDVTVTVNDSLDRGSSGDVTVNDSLDRGASGDVTEPDSPDPGQGVATAAGGGDGDGGGGGGGGGETQELDWLEKEVMSRSQTQLKNMPLYVAFDEYEQLMLSQGKTTAQVLDVWHGAINEQSIPRRVNEATGKFELQLSEVFVHEGPPILVPSDSQELENP